MKRKLRSSRAGTLLSATGAVMVGVVLTACSGGNTQEMASANDGPVAPMFEVDPFWPKPLPNHWIIGSAIGVSVDSRDHVWIIHRQQSLNPRTEMSAGTNPPTGECCVPAPPVLEFDPEGNLVSSWGGPG